MEYAIGGTRKGSTFFSWGCYSVEELEQLDLELEYALRGQSEEVPDRLLEFRYRERFHLSYEDFLNEPEDVYNYNMMIISKEAAIRAEAARFEGNAKERDSRPQ